MFIPKIKKKISSFLKNNNFISNQDGNVKSKNVVNIALLVLLMDSVSAAQSKDIPTLNHELLFGKCYGMEIVEGGILDLSTNGEFSTNPYELNKPAQYTDHHGSQQSVIDNPKYIDSKNYFFHSNNLAIDNIFDDAILKHHNCLQVVKKTWSYVNHSNEESGGFFG
ncbi:hypothetical protein HOK68_04040 [Candidatus Woesearchaeota archaeon]|jgi:hypothetical protein|nr:hypothetical protein [Candidatus Woesearchaeota archaeon]MBT4387343.1 hypothetical protein [Candidatus Woesearchaeota archaeon]MBT4595482.1 hypothetical protein [Candidatus Woesearchaeota archaeon]MBT5740668.1 hypothetical protein [Candidatus Woesearchaeota archaeon]MBT6505920.1 hypothetical protein [Candidatus Woesearchaeota archaeon]